MVPGFVILERCQGIKYRLARFEVVDDHHAHHKLAPSVASRQSSRFWLHRLTTVSESCISPRSAQAWFRRKPTRCWLRVRSGCVRRPLRRSSAARSWRLVNAAVTRIDNIRCQRIRMPRRLAGLFVTGATIGYPSAGVPRPHRAVQTPRQPGCRRFEIASAADRKNTNFIVSVRVRVYCATFIGSRRSHR